MSAVLFSSPVNNSESWAEDCESKDVSLYVLTTSLHETAVGLEILGIKGE